MFYWKPKADSQPVPVHQVQHWLKSPELYHLPLSLKGFQQIADIEEVAQQFLVLGKEGGRDGRNDTLRTRLLYVCVWEVSTAAASVSLFVVTRRISVLLLLHLTVWHVHCILHSLLKALMLILKIKKMFSSVHMKWERKCKFVCMSISVAVMNHHSIQQLFYFVHRFSAYVEERLPCFCSLKA